MDKRVRLFTKENERQISYDRVGGPRRCGVMGNIYVVVLRPGFQSPDIAWRPIWSVTRDKPSKHISINSYKRDPFALMNYCSINHFKK